MRTHRHIFYLTTVLICVFTTLSNDVRSEQLGAIKKQLLVGKWLIRIDGGGEIYSARFNFKFDGEESKNLGGVFSSDGKKAAIQSVGQEDGLCVVKLKTRRRGLPIQVMFAFEQVDDKLIGDVDFDSGTSVRSYEFEATRISGDKKKVVSQAPIKETEPTESASPTKAQQIANTTKSLPGEADAPKRSVSRKIAFQQGENKYQGTLDTEIWAIAPCKSLFRQGTMTTDGNNGGGESQVLMRFSDVFGNGDSKVPKLSRIVSAKLIVVAFDPGSTIYLHRLLVPWDDSATWDGMARGVSIDNVEASTVRDGFNFGEINMDKQSIEFDVTATVQKWANGEPNYGWVFLSTGGNGWDFYSSDWIELDSHPRLEIEFETSTVNIDLPQDHLSRK